MHAGIMGKSPKAGAWGALLAFVIWGALAIYWKALQQMDPLEIMCHRMVWSFTTLLPVIVVSGMLGLVLQTLRNKKTFLALLCSSFILAGNWLLFIWGVNSGMVLETSLGYFINPLLNFILGVALFHEKARKAAWAAIIIAASGVLYQVISLGNIPWVALGLGMSFAVYGAIRKIAMVEALPGLFIETAISFPLALAYLLWLGAGGVSVLFRADTSFILLLMLSGLFTTVPLFLFAFGVRRIRMTTLGLLQYISPSITFLLGVFLYKEDFSLERLVTFACMWMALALYTWDSFRHRRDSLKDS